MNFLKAMGISVVFLGAVIQLGGCSATFQARNADIKDSVLVNPAILEKGGDDQALYRYINPKASLKQYTKVMIDPVLVRKDGELDKETLDNFQKLANNAYFYLREELRKDYVIVSSPEPGAMKVQMAIVDADSSKTGPQYSVNIRAGRIALSVVKYGVTGKQAGVGEITAEMKLTDASTGQLLAAAVDRRVGGKVLTELWSSWYNADEALKFWAKQLTYNLCSMRGGANCVKPE